MSWRNLAFWTLAQAALATTICSCTKICPTPPSVSRLPFATSVELTESDDAAPETQTVSAATEQLELVNPIAKELLESVVVDEMDLDLTTPDEYRAGRLLWNAFANKPYESQFTKITTEHWFENWTAYKAHLLKLAQSKGFDVASLERCLAKIAPDQSKDTALLPVGAFVARRGSDTVWIIVCKWEWGTDSYLRDAEVRWPTVSHICVWAFTMKDIEEVAYVTCG